MPFYNSKVIRKGLTLGAIDTAIKRTVVEGSPENLVSVYIENGLARYAEANPTLYYSWERKFDLGPGIDAAVEFDGEWVKNVTEPNKYDFISEDIPWIFVVTDTGAVDAYYGTNVLAYNLCTSGAVKVAVVRGWKSLLDYTDDQGLVVFYLKNGNLYYRALIEIEDHSKVWDAEYLVNTNPGTITSFTCFRTNDYRIGIVYAQSGSIRSIITAQHWAGMASRPEEFDTRVSLNTALTYITRHSMYDTEIFNTDIGINVTELYGAALNVVSVTNNLGISITITFDEDIYGDVVSDTAIYTVTDSDGINWIVESVQASGNRAVQLNMEDFNNAWGDITVTMTGTGLTNQAGLIIADQNETFTPVGLVYVPKSPPVVTSITNIGDDQVKIVFDKDLQDFDDVIGTKNGDQINNEATITAGSYYSSYVPEATLGDNTWYWRANNVDTSILYADFLVARNIKQIELNNYYNFSTIIVYTSDNGVDWVEQVTTNDGASAKRIFIDVDVTARYFKIDFTPSGITARVYYMGFHESVTYGKEEAFSLTGYELNVGTNELDPVTYVILNPLARDVNAPAELNCIVLNIRDISKFYNAVGDLTVSFDQAVYDIQSTDRAKLETFSQGFTPTGLVPVPNPINAETFNANVSLGVTESPITKHYPEDKEIINTGIDLGITLTHIDDIT